MRVILALWRRNLKIFMRNKIQMGFTIIMPFFFLYVFGEIFNIEGIDNPLNYMLAGIIITNVFETAMNIGSTTIDDITTGFMKEVLVSPVKRIQIATGQILSGATVATVQSVITLFMGLFIGLRFTSIATPIGSIMFMIIVGIVFAGFGLLIATSFKNMQTFQVVRTAIAMPMMFLSGAYIPLSMLPTILRYVAYLNPMTYGVAFFRTVLLERMSETPRQLVIEQLAFNIGNVTITPWVSMLIVLVFGALFLMLSTIVFSKVDFSKINRSKNKADDIWDGM